MKSNIAKQTFIELSIIPQIYIKYQHTKSHGIRNIKAYKPTFIVNLTTLALMMTSTF